jgi:hypothetical protein
MLNGPNSWLLALQSLVLDFAPVASTKNEGLAGILIIILLVPFYSQRSQFLCIWTKKAHALCRSIALFWARNLLSEGVLAAPKRIFV